MSYNGKPDGFYVRFHRSAIQRILMGGIDRNLCFCIWTIGMAVGVMNRVYSFLLVPLLAHMLLRKLTQEDQDFFDIIKNSIHCRRCFW